MIGHNLNFVESITNTSVGFIISNFVAYFILPYWGFHRSIVNSVEVTLIFTVISVFRNFFIRTVFDRVTRARSNVFHV